MMERSGRVIAIHPRHMDVAVDPAPACNACGARKACHGGQDERVVALPRTPGIAVGATVSLALEDHRLIVTALFAYLMPAVGFVVGALLGDRFGPGNLAALLGAAAGLSVGLLLARALTTRLGKSWADPVIHPCSPLPHSNNGNSRP